MARSAAFGVLLGAAGFAIGFIGGELAGSSERCRLADTPCIENEAIFLSAAGGTFGMSLGVHLGNRRRGKLAADFLAAAGVWGAGIALAALTAPDPGGVDRWPAGILLSIPVAQLVTAIVVERGTARPGG